MRSTVKMSGEQNDSTFFVVCIKTKNSFLNKHALLFGGPCFLLGEKAPAGAGRPSKRGWSYQITFRSLVVKHPAPTQNFDRNFDIFVDIFWNCLGASGMHPGGR